MRYLTLLWTYVSCWSVKQQVGAAHKKIYASHLFGHAVDDPASRPPDRECHELEVDGVHREIRDGEGQLKMHTGDRIAC